MGVTVDLIPRLPGEDPTRAIGRIYEGGVALRWDIETGSMTLAPIDGENELAEEAPPGAFDPWRAEVRRRLADLYPWLVEVDGTRTFLWSSNCGWQIEMDDDSDSITLRARRGWDPDPRIFPSSTTPSSSRPSMGSARSCTGQMCMGPGATSTTRTTDRR